MHYDMDKQHDIAHCTSTRKQLESHSLCNNKCADMAAAAHAQAFWQRRLQPESGAQLSRHNDTCFIRFIFMKKTNEHHRCRQRRRCAARARAC